jgi:hypothetical protein
MPAIVLPPFADTSTVLVSLATDKGVVEVVVVDLLAEGVLLVPKNCAIARAKAKITTAAIALLGHIPAGLTTFTLRDLSIRQNSNGLVDSRSSILCSHNQKSARLLSFRFVKWARPTRVDAMPAGIKLALIEP